MLTTDIMGKRGRGVGRANLPERKKIGRGTEQGPSTSGLSSSRKGGRRGGEKKGGGMPRYEGVQGREEGRARAKVQGKIKRPISRETLMRLRSRKKTGKKKKGGANE